MVSYGWPCGAPSGAPVSYEPVRSTCTVAHPFDLGVGKDKPIIGNAMQKHPSGEAPQSIIPTSDAPASRGAVTDFAHLADAARQCHETFRKPAIQPDHAAAQEVQS